MKYIVRGEISKETEKAYGIDVGMRSLLWVPKSVVQDANDERGLVVAEWWAKRNAATGGAIARYKEA